MKEIGVLMKPDLAQAAHDGDKTKTRRVIENQDLTGAPRGGFKAYHFKDPETLDNKFGFENEDDCWVCPYGQPGDLIYVKEVHYAQGWWKAGGFTKTGKVKQRFIDESDDAQPVLFPNHPPQNICTGRTDFGYYKRNSLFLPKKHVRTWAKIKSIWVERLQDISEEDAKAEGVTLAADIIEFGVDGIDTYRDSFFRLWNLINADRGYGLAVNPWVWVIEFERI